MAAGRSCTVGRVPTTRRTPVSAMSVSSPATRWGSSASSRPSITMRVSPSRRLRAVSRLRRAVCVDAVSISCSTLSCSASRCTSSAWPMPLSGTEASGLAPVRPTATPGPRWRS